MATTTRIVVACPSCAQEVELIVRNVETEVDESLLVTHRDEPISLHLRTVVQAGGRHSCQKPVDQN